jgi:hypothetical protein
MSRRQVQAHTVLERRIWLVVQIDGHVVLAHDLLELLRRHPERDVQQVELRLGLGEERLAVRRRTPDEEHARQPLDPADRRVEAVCDRDRERPPHPHEPIGGGNDHRVEGDDTVEVRWIEVAQVTAAPAKVRVHASP